MSNIQVIIPAVDVPLFRAHQVEVSYGTGNQVTKCPYCGGELEYSGFTGFWGDITIVNCSNGLCKFVYKWQRPKEKK
jgi:hypothetical protein